MPEAGLSDAYVVVEPIEIPDLATMQTVFRLRSLARSAVADGVLTADDVARWEEDLRDRGNRGLFTYVALMFVAD
jgi:hypothetical protein